MRCPILPRVAKVVITCPPASVQDLASCPNTYFRMLLHCLLREWLDTEACCMPCHHQKPNSMGLWHKSDHVHCGHRQMTLRENKLGMSKKDKHCLAWHYARGSFPQDMTLKFEVLLLLHGWGHIGKLNMSLKVLSLQLNVQAIRCRCSTCLRRPTWELRPSISRSRL